MNTREPNADWVAAVVVRPHVMLQVMERDGELRMFILPGHQAHELGQQLIEAACRVDEAIRIDEKDIIR